ncbi:putative RNA polymerase sigma factor FecI [Marinomonas aquimarina]|uniref:Putative RNA polymerase sigma factor FecI n=1 Tax=Marinomonas aquimarina TaxID=295068 RepID=A0A1A8TD13_9GAMM|nr:sigma-70 family RNA polymerase sigma factor [Marinomonas aquimarina]SBS30992.1 putative RNA polymerase sigma factor FecI [Marinomonas aquimarina]
MQNAFSSHFASFYRQHHAWLNRFIARRLACEATAADLTQDSFIRLIARQDNLQTIESPRAYLTTIAKSLLANHWRRQDIEQAYLEALQAQPEPYAASAEEQYEVIETLCRLDAMLQGLPLKARQAFLMSRLQNVRYQDIASELEVSERMVKKYIAQALLQCAKAEREMDDAAA